MGVGRRCSGQWSLGESKVVRAPWKGKMRLNLESPSRWREERERQRPQSEGRGLGGCEPGESRAVLLQQQGVLSF